MGFTLGFGDSFHLIPRIYAFLTTGLEVNAAALGGILVVLSIILTLMPQNKWTLYDAPVSWGIYRNIPFTILGVLIVYLILKEAANHKDQTIRKIGIGIIISFACYLPVVLFATTYRLVGILMIPKTLAYLWIVYIGYKEIR